MAASRLRRIASLLGLSLCLSSCLPAAEAPQPFPGLVFYQGAKRFSFGAEPEGWLTDVPDGHGGRARILSIEDDFYTGRGFLLYICSLEGSPGRHLLYRYDGALGDSELVCELSPQSEPRFFALDNDYSPGFFVTVGEKEAYAFLGEDGAVVAIEGEACPYYACKWGYATSLRNPWNAIEYDYDFEKDDQSAFHFFDGTVASFPNRARVASAGEDKVLFVCTQFRGQLFQYDKEVGTTDLLFNEESWSKVYPDRRATPISGESSYSYLWKMDQLSPSVTLLQLQDGECSERSFTYGPDVNDWFTSCHQIAATDTFMLCGNHTNFRLDFGACTIAQIPSSGRRIDLTIDFEPFERTFYESEHIELIEVYKPGIRSATAAYYVRQKDVDRTILVAANGSLLYCDRVVEIKANA